MLYEIQFLIKCSQIYQQWLCSRLFQSNFMKVQYIMRSRSDLSRKLRFTHFILFIIQPTFKGRKRTGRSGKETWVNTINYSYKTFFSIFGMIFILLDHIIGYYITGYSNRAISHKSGILRFWTEVHIDMVTNKISISYLTS